MCASIVYFLYKFSKKEEEDNKQKEIRGYFHDFLSVNPSNPQPMQIDGNDDEMDLSMEDIYTDNDQNVIILPVTSNKINGGEYLENEDVKVNKKKVKDNKFNEIMQDVMLIAADTNDGFEENENENESSLSKDSNDELYTTPLKG